MKKKSICVLYIEDNLNDFLLIQRFLSQITKEEEAESFELERVDLVAKGVERIQKGGVDVLLTDLNLPDSRELEAVTTLLSHFPMLPIIVLTSAYSKNLGIEAVRKGAQDYLLKDELNARMIKHSIRYAIERKQLDMMKDEFVSMISHELLTPLTIMKVGLDNLNMGVAEPLTPKQKELLIPVTNNINRLARIIHDILDISRMHFGKFNIYRQMIDLKSLLQEIVKEFYEKTKTKNIIIEAKVPDIPDVYADPNLIVQVLHNLLSNAERYARSKIQVSAKPVDQTICVCVLDDGLGISSNDQNKIFNKFEQVNRPEGGQGYKGTGLGLAICKEIIERHEGKIWVESEVGQGCQFCFTIPLTQRNLS